MKNKIKQLFIKSCLRLFMAVYLAFLQCFAWLRLKKKPRERLEILVSGTFYSDQWLMTHLLPLIRNESCAVVRMVSSIPVPEYDKLQPCYPPKWLQNIFGGVAARMLLFSWLAIKTRPDILFGFHILLNGLFAGILGKLTGARSIYVCGGGPKEVIGGGYSTQNRLFNKLDEPDYLLERMLLKAISRIDLVVSMGTGAIEFFQENGVDTDFEIIPGGFDDRIFNPSYEDKEFDLVLVGRLSNVKRVDIFLKAIKQAKQEVGAVSAVIVGDGPDRETLEKLAVSLEIKNDVFFAGWQANVNSWLKKSRIFSLTSESEGLSQALIQAMMCGLPAVVTDVGDLSDLVSEARNGFLVPILDSSEFAKNYVTLLKNDEIYKKFSSSAIESTDQYKIDQVSNKWSEVFLKIYN